MNIIVIFVGITSIVYLILTLLVFKKWKYGKVYRRYILFLITGTLWVIIGTLEVSDLYKNIKVNLVLSKIDFILASLIAYFVALFSIHFPRENSKFNLSKEILFLIPILVINFLVLSERVFYYIGSSLTYTITWYLIYFSVVLIYFIIASVNLIQKIKSSTGVCKIQLKYILFGLLITVFIGLTFSVYYAFNSQTTPVQIFGYAGIGSLVFASMSFYAIARYRFLDTRVVLRRGVIYSLSLLLSLAIFTYLALLLKDTIEQNWQVNPTWTAAILIFLVALGFSPLKKLVEQSVNTLFKGKKSIDLAVKEVREKIAQKTDLETLIDLICTEVKKYLDVKEVSIYVIDHREQRYVVNDGEESKTVELNNILVRYFEKYTDVLVRDEIPHQIENYTGKFEREMLQSVEKELKKHKASLAMPFRTEEEMFGLLLIGEREGNRAYSVQDVQFLERVKSQVTPTLANALLYKEAVERVRERAAEKA